jgi:hypothetical protein
MTKDPNRSCHPYYRNPRPHQEDLSQFPSNSERQQAAVAAVADQDAFNWGYDPVHYGVPEGSYSMQPDGPLRVLEYREMVQVRAGGQCVCVMCRVDEATPPKKHLHGQT